MLFLSFLTSPKLLSTFKISQRHGFHLVDPSPWPLFASLSVLMLTFGAVMSFHGYSFGFSIFIYGLISLLCITYCWWRDVIREGTFEGKHTSFVQRGLMIGMLLFIVSEVMFFFAFFCAFFWFSFYPNSSIGCFWSPFFFFFFLAWKVPLLNTTLLLSSGASVTWAHHAIISGSKFNGCLALSVTVILAIFFTFLQGFEYLTAPFNISDGSYGSSFYMATGFHGFHVILGTCFLFVCLMRLYFDHFTREHHLGFEAAAWYWHFVDVIWLFLFISIYWWGS